MLFQLVLLKFFKRELFLCLPKVDHVIKSCKEPIDGTPLPRPDFPLLPLPPTGAYPSPYSRVDQLGFY